MTTPPSQAAGAAVRATRDDAGREALAISGRLDSTGVQQVWRPALDLAARSTERDLVVDASAIEYLDGAGASLLFALQRQRRAAGANLTVRGLRPEFDRILELIQPEESAEPEPRETRDSFFVNLGRASVELARDTRELVVFVGELTVCLFEALRRPRTLRMADVMLFAERAGIGALPIIALLGFLLGLILAFQSAIPMRDFGAEIFVADLLGLATLRELGPLMAAILLTARSGSAFAAEIGTMKVNEEIDALATMGLEPVRFLVVPRVIAAMLVIPVLAMLMNVFMLAGGAVVMTSLGVPFVTFTNRVVASVTIGDFTGGLLKGFVFGLIVAAVGCLRGLQTGSGAGAVGLSTTSSVVSGIVLITVTDGIFAVLFYLMGI